MEEQKSTSPIVTKSRFLLILQAKYLALNKGALAPPKSNIPDVRLRKTGALFVYLARCLRDLFALLKNVLGMRFIRSFRVMLLLFYSFVKEGVIHPCSGFCSSQKYWLASCLVHALNA